MKIDTLTVGAFEVNCLVIHGTDQRVIIVDPGDDAGRIADFISTHKLKVDAYLLTHGHADHLSALATLAGQYPAPAGMHPADAAWAFSSRNQIPPYYPIPESPPGAMRPLREGSGNHAAGLDYAVLETPGHTPGCVCFYFQEAGILISGDTLFAGSAGRTDLPGGNATQLNASLRRLASLGDQVRVYPGHGQTTTIGIEKKTNFCMQQALAKVGI